MKKCSICEETKSLENFGNHKIFKDGKSNHCKSCKSTKGKRYYLKNQEKRKLKSNEYYKNNRETILLKINKEEKKIYRKYYYETFKEVEQANTVKYRKANKDAIKTSKRLYRLKNRDKINAHVRHRLQTDPLLKIKKIVRSRTSDFLVTHGFKKTQKFHEYIGCSGEELYNHINRQMTKEMSWENHATVWELDHIIPLAAAKREEQIYELSHYTNLQPLPINENRKKSSKLNTCWQKFQKNKNIDVDKKAGLPFDLEVSQFDLAFEQIGLEHRQFIKKYEWLGTIGFGVKWVFTARWQGNLAGVVMMSEPNSYQFGKEEALIQRGAVSSWAPKNLNSRLVMFSCNWMVRNTVKRIFTAYSDPSAGEIGTIYQACNFDYLGQQHGAKYYFKLDTGRLVGSRHFTRTSAMKKWAKELNIEWQKDWCKPNGFQDVTKIPDIIKEYAKTKIDQCEKVKQESKGKYVLLLNYGKNKIKKTWTGQKYPKRWE